LDLKSTKEESVMANVGCARPTGASVNQPAEAPATSPAEPTKEIQTMVLAKVGKPAPDFEAPAYHKGEFTSAKLSDYLGKWTLVCFYPGDFTYV
jgi:peroxiredoxin (alkyl hydroperoxide reductase subunit C)